MHNIKTPRRGLDVYVERFNEYTLVLFVPHLMPMRAINRESPDSGAQTACESQPLRSMQPSGPGFQCLLRVECWNASEGLGSPKIMARISHDCPPHGKWGKWCQTVGGPGLKRPPGFGTHRNIRLELP